MLTLQKLLSLPILLSTTLIAHALAASEGLIDMDVNGDDADYAAALTGGEECDHRQLKAIRDGFNEMNKLFQAAVQVNWTGDVERDFFGEPERVQNYTDMIESNLRRAAQYSNLKGNTTRNPDIHVRCDDPNNKCDQGNSREGKHTAYNIANEPHINFCKHYFRLDCLEMTVDKEAENPSTKMEIMQYYNRATAWARQVMHISSVGTAIVERVVPNVRSNTSEWTTSISDAAMNTSFLAGVRNEHPYTPGPNNIQALKWAYGATRAKLLAVLSTQEPYDAPNNAENYALYAQARYVMEKKNFYPKLPIMKFDNEATVFANDELQEGERKRYAFFDQTDVLPHKKGTNSVGAPISSSASSTTRITSRWMEQASFALYWAFACCLVLSMLG